MNEMEKMVVDQDKTTSNGRVPWSAPVLKVLDSDTTEGKATVKATEYTNVTSARYQAPS